MNSLNGLRQATSEVGEGGDLQDGNNTDMPYRLAVKMLKQSVRVDFHS